MCATFSSLLIVVCDAIPSTGIDKTRCELLRRSIDTNLEAIGKVVGEGWWADGNDGDHNVVQELLNDLSSIRTKYDEWKDLALQWYPDLFPSVEVNDCFFTKYYRIKMKLSQHNCVKCD